MNSRDLLPMGEISRRSGFAASAIRYYESEGLIEAHRSGGGQRRFERSVLRRLAFIRAAPAKLEFVVFAPIPEPVWPDGGEKGYTARMATEVLPVLRRELAVSG